MPDSATNDTARMIVNSYGCLFLAHETRELSAMRRLRATGHIS